MIKKISIAIDAMGGDNSPDKTVEGISLFIKKNQSKDDFFLNLYGDKNKIAEKIDFFYKNPKITVQMGIKARNTIEEKGSWEKMTENIIEFCKVNKN